MALITQIAAMLDVHAGGEPVIAVALSGGGDSMALLRLALAWARPRRRVVNALIVDHARRPDSAAEAAWAAEQATRLGAKPRILSLRSDTNAVHGGQNTARLARHRALAQACASKGLRVLLLGHTRDDQLETMAMRAQRSRVTARGLASMAVSAPSPTWPEGAGLQLIRPLLARSRAELRAFLRAEGQDWVEDPSNAARRYERVRVRAAVAQWRAAGLSDGHWVRVNAFARLLDQREQRAALGLLRRAVRWDLRLGRADLDLALYRGAPPTVRQRALEALLAGVSGVLTPPPATRLRRLDGALMETDGRVFAGSTLGGAVLAPSTKPGAYAMARVARDPGAVSGRGDQPSLDDVFLDQGAELVWDGRWRINPSRSPGVLRSDGFQRPVFIGVSGPEQPPSMRFLGPMIVARLLRPCDVNAWRV